MTIPPQPLLFLPQNFFKFFHTQKPQNPLTMNDPRFHLSKTNDHNFKDPFHQNGSRSSSQIIDHEFVQFRPNSHSQNAAESDDSGVCSPPLWKSSPSPLRSPSAEPLLSHHVYRNLSPASRLQAITRGQKELMEMVKNMPESSYELSLKDLVEHHRIEVDAPPLSDRSLPQRGVVRVKRQESKRNEKSMVRNGSFELESKGLFLKMVFPFSLQPKKRRNLDRSFSGRVSVKVEAVKGGGGCGEGDWWRKKSGGSSGSDSSRISNSGGGSSRSSSGGSSSGRSYGGGRKKNGFSRGCWSFFRSKKGKSEE